MGNDGGGPRETWSCPDREGMTSACFRCMALTGTPDCEGIPAVTNPTVGLAWQTHAHTLECERLPP